MTVRPKPIPGVEIRERRPRNGPVYYVYRVRFRNARGKRDQRTFDSPQDAEDFRARMRLLKRAGDLAVLERGNEPLGEFIEDFWRLYAEVRLEPTTRRKYRCLWRVHLEPRLGAMRLRQITPLVVSEFVVELQRDGVGAATVRSCLGLLQSAFARAVEWDRASVNVVKLIAKPRAPQMRTVRPLSPAQIEAIREQLLRDPERGLRDATLVSVLAYVGLRPEEALALEYAHIGKETLRIEQRWVDGGIVSGQKTGRPPRFPPLLNVLRADLQEYQAACGARNGLVFVRPDGKPWHDHDWRHWRSRTWQPACEAAGLATIVTTSMATSDGKHKSKRTYRGPVPYDLRHSFASLLLEDGTHSVVQIAEWLGHSPAMLLSKYAHVIADLQGRNALPDERAITAARRHRQREPATNESQPTLVLHS